MAKWTDKLTKSEVKHLKEFGVTTWQQAKVNAENQRKQRSGFPRVEPCFECKHINKKLGLPV